MSIICCKTYIHDYSYRKEKDLLFIFQFKIVNAFMIVNFLNVNTNQREQNDNDNEKQIDKKTNN